MTKNFAANLKIGAALGSSVNRVFGGLKAKIKDQENTLKGLRSAYKDASRGTGEYAGKLDELRAKINSAERDLRKLRAAANFDIAKGFRNVGNVFGRDLRRAGIAGGIVGAAGLGIAKNMLDVTAAFEKSLTVLKTVEGSEAKAQQSFAWIQEFAQKTPFELQQVTDAFVRLRAYGIDPIRGDSLRILGDTASAMGKDVMDAVEAIADAVTGENERLKEFGIKASKDGAKITYTWTDRAGKQLAKTVDGNNRAMIQSTILAIWNSKYKGAMDEQSKIWNGMVSNIKDTWARFAYDVMQSGPFEELKAQLKSYLDQLGVWAKDGTMKRWAEETGRWVVDAGKKIKEIATTFYNALDAAQNFLGGWDKLMIALAVANFAPTIASIAQLAKGLYSLGAAWFAGMGPIGWAILGVTSFAALLISIVDPGGPLDILGKMFPETMDKVRSAVESAVNWIGDKIDALVAKIRWMFEAIDSLTGSTWMSDTFFKESGKGWPSVKPDYSLPRTNYGSIIGDKPAGIPSPLGMPPPIAPKMEKGDMIAPKGSPSATQEDILKYLKTPTNQTSNNTYNINVNAPGANGDEIAERIRRAFEAKPLFDSDGALAPG